MVKEEWKSLLKSPLMILVVIGIAIIPIIYAGLFLKSMWDPYGMVNNLPVAVVNNDQPVEYNEKTLQIGDDLIDELQENDSLAFNFVDEQVAESGLRNGTYYMVITIPENFSKNASTLLDEKPQKMILDYQTNPGTNYIASKMSETAILKIRDSIADEVTKVYAETVFDKIGTIGDGMQDAADGSKKLNDGAKSAKAGSKQLKDGIRTAAAGSKSLKDGIKTAADGNTTITKNLGTLASSTITFKEGSATLKKGLKEYTEGVSQVNTGTKSLKDGMKVLVEKVPTLTSGVNQLNNGVKQYTAGVGELNENSGVLTGGSKQLQAGTDTLVAGVSDLKDGVQAAKVGSDSLDRGLKEYVAGVDQLAIGLLGDKALQIPGYLDGVAQLQAGAKTLSEGTAEVSKQVNGLSGAASNIGALSSMLDGVKSNLASSGDAVQNISTSAQNIASAVQSASGSMGGAVAKLQEASNDLEDKANDKVEEANERIQSANDSMEEAESTISSAKGQLEVLVAGANPETGVSPEELASIIETLSYSSKTIEEVDALDTSTYDATINAVMESMTQAVSDAGSALNEEKVNIETNVDTLAGNAESLKGMGGSVPTIPKDSLEKLSGALSSIHVGADNLYGGLLKLSTGSTALEEGAAKLKANGMLLLGGSNALNSGLGQLDTGMVTLSDGVSALQDGATKLDVGLVQYTAGVSQLNENSGALISGSQQLADGAKTLGDGAGQLNSGVSELYAGTNKLVANNKKLNDGAKQLDDGASQIQSGSKKLYDGSKTLQSGMTKLKSGASTLTSGMDRLEDGAGELDYGLGTLKDGTNTLYKAVNDGAKEVKEVKTNDDTMEMFASPVMNDATELTKVENNGHAMAPYMMSVGLWVGTLAFCLLYPLMKPNGTLNSGFAWWASKASVVYSVAIAQAVILIGLLHVFNGFNPAQMGKTVLFACLAAITFASIMYFFNITMGKFGSFLMLVYMVVQLAGSAGTYPVEISPSFVGKIHNILPFTYTVNAFRSTIAAGESIMPSVIFLGVLFTLFTVLTVISFNIKMKRRKENKFILFDWLEERGLA